MRSLLKQAALLLAMTLPAAAHDGVRITDPYARILVGNGAVYFLMSNHATTDDVLVAASSPDAAMVHLMHSNADASGVMTMTEVAGGFPVATGDARTLAGGGDHVMLMGVAGKKVTGDTITLVLQFERAGAVTLTVPVDNRRTSAPGIGPTAFDARATAPADHTAHAMGQSSLPAGPDADMIVAALQAMFDRPGLALTVGPLAVLGGHAVASWGQGDIAGRALLARQHGQWQVVLCGGTDLRSADFLAANGVADAVLLSRMFNQAEDRLGAAAVSRYSSFKGVTLVSQPAHN